MSIEFLNESGFEGVNEEMLIDVASYAFGAMDINPDAECTITCVDLKTIEDLHVRWMDLEGPTDVMSFPMDELTPGASPVAAAPMPPTRARPCWAISSCAPSSPCARRRPPATP